MNPSSGEYRHWLKQSLLSVLIRMKRAAKTIKTVGQLNEKLEAQQKEYVRYWKSVLATYRDPLR